MNRLLLIILFVCASFCHAQTVDFIEYRVLPVFDEEGECWGPYDYRWVYGVLNKLHISSRPMTIGRFLAFEIGDSLDETKIAESERRLRESDFIGEAEIELVECDSGTIAVVTVKDLWTTKIAPAFSYKGHVSEWRLELEEVNLLGLGLQVRGAYEHDEDYNRWLFGTTLPRILPGGGSLSAFHSNESKAVGPKSTSISVFKGRRSDRDRLLYRAGAYSGGGLLSTWRDANASGPSFRIDDRTEYIGAKFLPLKEIGIGAGMRSAELYRELTTENGLSIRRSYDIISFGMSYLNREFYSDIYVDAFGRTEDIPIGWLLETEAGLGAEFGFDYSMVSLAQSNFVGENLISTNIYYHRIENTESVGGALRFSSGMFLSSRLCGRLAYMSITNGLPENSFRVGGQSVLRSHRSYAQVGEKTAFANLEWRIFTPLEIFSVRLGGAVFADAGTAWSKSNDGFDLLDTPKPLLSDVGLELRFGSTSSTTDQIARLSVAITNEGLWELSLSSGQLFRTYIGLEHGVPIP